MRRSPEITSKAARAVGSPVRTCRRRPRPALPAGSNGSTRDSARARPTGPCRCSRRPPARYPSRCGRGPRRRSRHACRRRLRLRRDRRASRRRRPRSRGHPHCRIGARPRTRRALRHGGARPLPAIRCQPALLELPPVVAAEIQLRLLLHLDIATEASVWRRVGGGQVECVLSLGADTGSRRIRAAARAAISGRGGLSLIGSSTLRAVQVRRFGEPAGAIVISVFGDPRRDVGATSDAAAAALAPVLERELLLERDAAKERASSRPARSG